MATWELSDLAKDTQPGKTELMKPSPLVGLLEGTAAQGGRELKWKPCRGWGAYLSWRRPSCCANLAFLPACFALNRGLNHRRLEEAAKDKKSEGFYFPGRHSHEMGWCGPMDIHLTIDSSMHSSNRYLLSTCSGPDMGRQRWKSQPRPAPPPEENPASSSWLTGFFQILLGASVS